MCRSRAARCSHMSFLRECSERVRRIEDTLRTHEAARGAVKRKREEERTGLRLLDKVAKEQRDLEKASKKLREQESRAREETAWKDYWTCSKFEEMRQLALMEKSRADEAMRVIALYEQRFGRLC